MAHVVVVGGGQAGASCVAKLRSAGYEGEITLLCGEDALPYQRPPLSKAYLLGDMSLERMFLRPQTFYDHANITVRLGAVVETIDPAAKTISLPDAKLSYDELVLTTGSTPRLLPVAIGGNLAGVYPVRSLMDVDSMAPEFEPGRKVLIIGGGNIGLEAAAVAAKKGLNVVLVEMANRILKRVASPETSNFFRELHTGHGVDIREGVGLQELTGDGRVSGATLSDGSSLEVDFVIVGVGIAPDTSLAEAAGLDIDNGIKVDTQGRTSDPHIWAAGDCASFPHAGQRIRLESVPNAIDQAEVVAENILGAGKDYQAKPWFWSDQYDVKLQIAGLNTGYDRVVTRQAGPATSFWYFRGDQLLAVDAANDPRGYMIGKRLIEAGKTAGPAVLADPNANLKDLLKA